jgi:hypothetical protein
MPRRLAAFLLIACSFLLVVDAPAWPSLRADAGCPPDGCCCRPATAGASDACCAVGTARAPRLVPACACGGSDGSRHATSRHVRLALPGAACLMDAALPTDDAVGAAAGVPTSRAIGPDPPPPRRGT